MPVVVVGFSGKLGSGKNTTANIVSALLTPVFVPHAFFSVAEPLKTMATALSGDESFSLDVLGKAPEGYKDRPFALAPEGDDPMTNGQFLVWLGDALRARFGPDVFVRSLEQRIASASTNAPLQVVLVTDIRYPSELAWIRNVGGIAVRVNGDPAGVRARSSRDPTHSSETALDGVTDWNVVIDNGSSDMDALWSQVEQEILPLILQKVGSQ